MKFIKLIKAKKQIYTKESFKNIISNKDRTFTITKAWQDIGKWKPLTKNTIDNAMLNTDDELKFEGYYNDNKYDLEFLSNLLNVSGLIIISLSGNKFKVLQDGNLKQIL